MSYLVITSGGLSEVVNGSYPTYSIKYFQPIYDHRIDPDIHSGVGVVSADALTVGATSATTYATLIGEKIWNLAGTTSAYSISNDRLFVYKETSPPSRRATSVGVGQLTNATQDRPSFINLINTSTGSYPLSNVVSGTSITDDDAGTFTITGLTEINALSPDVVSSANRNYLFQGVTYTPEVSSNSYTQGLFKCRLGNTVGNFKFNKIALYLQKLDSNGTVDVTSDPVLFAIAVMNKAVEKTSDGSQYENFEVDVALSFNANASNTIWYNSDYWTKIPNMTGQPQGLFHQGDVAIGQSGTGGTWSPKAHLHVTETNKPAIGMSYDHGTTLVGLKCSSTGAFAVSTSAVTQPLMQVATSAYASGKQAVAIGNRTSATGDYSLSIGNISADAGSTKVTRSKGNYSIAIGNDVGAGGLYDIVIGSDGSWSDDNGEHNFILGSHNISRGNFNFGFGKNNNLGTSNYVTSSGIVFGSENDVSGTNVYAFGFNNTNYGENSFIFGQSNKIATNLTTPNPISNVYAFGHNVSADSKDCFVHGYDCNISQNPRSIIIGGYQNNLKNDAFNGYAGMFAGKNNIIDNSPYSVSLGGYSNVISSTTGSVTLGGNNNLIKTNGNAENAIVVGNNNTIEAGAGNLMTGSSNRLGISDGSSTYNFVAGSSNIVSGSNSIVAGNDNRVDSVGSIVVGAQNIIIGADYCAVAGYGNLLREGSNVGVFGNGAVVSAGSRGVVVGTNGAMFSGQDSVVIGNDINGAGANGLTLGEGSSWDLGRNVLSVGHGNQSPSTSNTALLFGTSNKSGGSTDSYNCGMFGYNNRAYGNNSFAFGSGVYAYGNNSFAVGISTTATANSGAMSFGKLNYAYGQNSFAFGLKARSGGENSVLFNLTDVGTDASYIANTTDESFEVYADVLKLRGASLFTTYATSGVQLIAGTKMTLQRGEVAHGFTSIEPTDNYASIGYKNDATGGLQVRGFTDSKVGLVLESFVNTEVTDDDVMTTEASILINGAKRTGTGPATLGDTANILLVQNNGAAKLLVKGNGDLHYSNSDYALDEYDDIALVDTARYKFAGWEDKVIKENEQILTDTGVLSPNGMISTKGMTALNLGAIGQLYNMVREMAEKLNINEKELKEMAKRYK